ncbi:hypothetical protein J5X84_16325 [Streptosporangiaceae bacterium NEAU-GS5]|nr:hypothetical protein [Streptosporangiaceae bacterium NEAU-GS5]
MGSEYGVHISGGDVNGPIAMGPHASATVNNAGASSAGRSTVDDLLDRLDALIREHEVAIADAASASRDAADVRGEAARPEPDRLRILDALKRLSIRAAEVTAILDVVAKIREFFSK